MNVLLISQCSKNALTETRRILDQFAERRGDRTWQTAITKQGLETLRRLLKSTARKNTAVACHWIRGWDNTEMLWIVGNAGQFNAQGAVPTNTTTRDVLRKRDENDWHSAEDIRLLAIMASLFHDIGKASHAFQAKLQSRKPLADAYRHEWVSLRLFEAFVGKGTDEDWLQRLASVSDSSDLVWLDRLVRDDQSPTPAGPFKKGQLPSLAQVVGWLIVSHHRIPCAPQRQPAGMFANLPDAIRADWNALRPDSTAQEKSDCWRFDRGLPFASRDWVRHVNDCAKAMLARAGFVSKGAIYLSDPYVMHLARLALMLADHHYSSLPSDPRRGDLNFPIFANTARDTGEMKQRLDEHLIGVASHARKLIGVLPRLEHQLPRIARHKGFKRRAGSEAFRWQDKAFDLAIGLHTRARQQGFFGINMASTGCGKTLANGRILYGLSDPQRGARFSIALGLRTLTLQTGQVYRERLGLGEDDLAVLVGGTAVRELFALGQHAHPLDAQGSESAQELLPDNSYVHFEANVEDGPLRQWLSGNPGASKLVNAPILACTIDHLMPATESTRGGHQIAPILRLLTADLVLDEVDDFDIADLPALTRLVHWAGLFGTRVLLSSATLPPALVRGLFDAYREGRCIFQRHRSADPFTAVCCAWFDEFNCTASDHCTPESFATDHAVFVGKRLHNLREAEVRRIAKIQPFTAAAKDRDAICRALATELPAWMGELHGHHHCVDPAGGKRVSVGIVRFANIEPMIAVARALYEQGAPEGMRLHLCVYHSRHPLLIRSRIEQLLDQLLQRQAKGRADTILDHPLVRQAVERYHESDQLFVVLASPVAEVGRDHDYDWAIVEPSSMRSIIQLAGRIRRHRKGTVQTPNLYLLEHNVRSLQGERVAYQKPGFESTQFLLKNHGLSALLTPEQLSPLDAAPRIEERLELHPSHNLVDLEHRRLRALMLAEGEPLPVSLWWETRAALCAELQVSQRFRAGQEEQAYALMPDEDDEERARFHRDDGGDWSAPLDNLLEKIELKPGARVGFWGAGDYLVALNELADALGQSPRDCAKRFGVVHLRDNTQGWRYHTALGFQKHK